MSLVRSLVTEMLREGWGEKPTGKAGAELCSRVERLAGNGDGEATRELAAAAREYFRREWVRLSKQEAGYISVTRQGQVIAQPPQMYATRNRDANGAKTAEFQLRLWLDLTWDELDRLIDELTVQRDTLTANLTPMRHLRSLRAKYPAAQTPRELCRLAGIDPESIAL